MLTFHKCLSHVAPKYFLRENDNYQLSGLDKVEPYSPALAAILFLLCFDLI